MKYLLALLATTLAAQSPRPLTLAEAEALAVRNHPRVMAAKLRADAAQESITQVKANTSPIVSFDVTGSLADHGSRLGTGPLNIVNPGSLFSRSAGGININQNLFDFGRTRSLTESARYRTTAERETATAVRAEIILRVREAYFRALLAQSQLQVNQQTVADRRLTVKQITALAESNLRSTLDVSFAELNLAEAELLFDRARNDWKSAQVLLAAALGETGPQEYQLQDQPLPPLLDQNADSLVAQALQSRPDLASLRAQEQAAQSFAESERRQSLPSLSARGVAGYYGPRDERLQSRYGAIGVNLNIPVWNGRLFSSRRQEADLRSQAAHQETRDLELRIARDLRAAFIDAENAFQRLSLTDKVLNQAQRTLKLAQTRYDLGLGSIVELSQAQLSRTSAEVLSARARFEYLLSRALLDFHAGNLK